MLAIVVGLDTEKISSSAECFAKMNLGSEQEEKGMIVVKLLRFSKANKLFIIYRYSFLLHR